MHPTKEKIVLGLMMVQCYVDIGINMMKLLIIVLLYTSFSLMADERSIGSYTKVDLTKYGKMKCRTDMARVIGVLKYGKEPYYQLEIQCRANKVRRLLATEQELTSVQFFNSGDNTK